VDVLWAGTFLPDFERNRRLAEYLAAVSATVRIVREDLWPEDRVSAFGKIDPLLVLRALRVYASLFVRLLMAPAPDVYLVSYPGWFDVPVVKSVAFLKRRPVVFDIFISLWDTAVIDRGLVAERSKIARLVKYADRLSMRMSSRVIADCRPHARFLAELGGVDEERFGVVYIGADESIYHPNASQIEPRRVLFYGSYVPLQGTEVIVEAASRLIGEGIDFRMIGSGQSYVHTREVAEECGAHNVEFVDRMSPESLAREMAEAALCLGIFGASPKAGRVIPHKVFEALAVQRPILTGDTPAVRELFSEAELLMVPVGDPVQLAAAIRAAVGAPDRLQKTAELGHSRFVSDFARVPQSRRLLEELEKAIDIT
jgi:glycosyltransferase involved in cell wall biosynthesis